MRLKQERKMEGKDGAHACFVVYQTFCLTVLLTFRLVYPPVRSWTHLVILARHSPCRIHYAVLICAVKGKTVWWCHGNRCN